MLFKILGMRLGPFRGTEQPRFFAIPERVNNGPLRFPALLQQFGKPAHLFHLGDRARKRICSAVDPAVMMIAANHPLVRIFGAGNAHDHVIQLVLVPVEFQTHMHLRGTRTDVIRNRQSAAPVLRRDRPFQRSQQRLRVAVRHGKHRNFGKRFRFAQRQPLRAGNRADARRERIAGIQRHIHHAPALRAVPRAIGTVREHVALKVTVIAWIGIDDAGHRAMLGRDLRLDAAPGLPVARDHDGSADRDAHPRELFVVGGDAVVDVHQRRSRFAVDRVGVINRKLLALLIGGGVDRDGRLLQLGGELGRLDHFHQALFGSRKEHVEILNVRIQAPAFELRQEPLGIVLIVRRPDMMRPRGKPLHIIALILRAGDGSEFLLPG